MRRPLVFFTGAGMSAESGVPTYRGRGGIRGQYDWREYACQRAFDADPHKVLVFHEERRAKVPARLPNAGHVRIAQLQAQRDDVAVITQNTDGLHARAGASDVVEPHGSLWRMRCATHGRFEDLAGPRYARRMCAQCGAILRPDIMAREAGAHMIEVNIDATGASDLFDEHWRGGAGELISARFGTR